MGGCGRGQRLAPMLSRSFSNPISAKCWVNTLELLGVVVEDFAIYKQGDLYV